MWFQLFRHAREGRAPFANLRNEVLAEAAIRRAVLGLFRPSLSRAVGEILAIPFVGSAGRGREQIVG